jgi:hypothetical protein
LADLADVGTSAVGVLEWLTMNEATHVPGNSTDQPEPGSDAEQGPGSGTGAGPGSGSGGVRDRRRRMLLLGGAGVVAAGAGTAWLLRDGAEPAVPTSLVLATGPRGAVFLEVGGDVAQAIRARSPGTRVQVLTTSATVDNLNLLATNRADLGFGAIDAVISDPRVRSGGISTICRLYDSFLHLVVRDGSPLRQLSHLAGRRVAVGAAGSGTEFTAMRLLSATGIQPAQLPRLGQAPAMQAVGDGAVDAAFSLTGFPTPAIKTLADRHRIRLIPLGEEYFRILDGSIPRVYGPAPIPEGAYPGVPVTESVYVPNVLLARAGLPDDTVTMVVEVILSPASRRFWIHPDSRRFDLRAAIATGPLRLHPAALAWLRAQKP